MRNLTWVNTISKACILMSLVLMSFGSFAVSATATKHKKDRNEEFQKVLEGKGYTHISELSVTKSEVRTAKYFVNFVDSGKICDAYFTKKGVLVEVHEVAKI